MTVEALFHDWIAELERKGRSPSTIHNYDRTYRVVRQLQGTSGEGPGGLVSLTL